MSFVDVIMVVILSLILYVNINTRKKEKEFKEQVNKWYGNAITVNELLTEFYMYVEQCIIIDEEGWKNPVDIGYEFTLREGHLCTLLKRFCDRYYSHNWELYEETIIEHRNLMSNFVQDKGVYRSRRLYPFSIAGGYQVPARMQFIQYMLEGSWKK